MNTLIYLMDDKMYAPTLKQLTYVLALARSQHFGKAAKACFVSQSAFSTAIKELESTLNLKLFDRNNKSVNLTQEGVLICQQANKVLLESQQLMELAQSLQDPFNRTLRLGIIPTIAPFILPNLLKAANSQFPQLTLIIDEDKTDHLKQKLKDNKVDLTIMALPIELEGLNSHVICSDEFYLLSHKNHCPWVSDDQSLWPNQSVLLLEQGNCLSEHTIATCHLQAQSQISPITANSILSLIAMIRSGLGVGYVSSMMLDLIDKQTFNIKRQAGSARDIGLVWRAHSDFGPLHQFLNEVIFQALNNDEI